VKTILDAYLIDKAIYEINYELNNRPDWVGLPLQGILQVLKTGDETTADEVEEKVEKEPIRTSVEVEKETAKRTRKAKKKAEK
jgi:hypothetical protein